MRVVYKLGIMNAISHRVAHLGSTIADYYQNILLSPLPQS